MITGSTANKVTVRILMKCMITLEEVSHLQKSSKTTQVPILGTTKELSSSSILSDGRQTKTESEWMSSASFTLGNPEPASLTAAITTRTTESQGISSLAKRQGKSSLMATTDSTLSGSTSSGEPQCRSHYFSDCVINGIIESRPREGLSLSVICGRCLSPLQHIQIIGGDNVLSIWKTQGNCGEDSLESITYQKLPDTTAIPLSSSIQRPSMTNSLVRMKKRQPQSRSKSKPKDNEQKPWS